MSELTVVSDAERLAEAAARRIVALASAAVARRGRFVVALSGGSTPRATYRLLATEPHASAIDWLRVQVFWGDERCVPPHHADSNYRVARRALLDHVDLPARNVHRIRGELTPEEAAAAYRAELEAALGDRGRFDLILLGLGPDGHTASLFPGTTALEEGQRAVVAVHLEELGAWRVTLTLPVLNAARHVMFLVSGADKANALARVLEGERLPAGLVQPSDGSLTWLVDRKAAAGFRSGGWTGGEGARGKA